MKKMFAKWKTLSCWLRAFFFVALAFLAVGLGTLGSVQSTGGSYELQYQTTEDAKAPSVVFNVSVPKSVQDNLQGRSVRLTQVYLNLGNIYSQDAAVTLILTGSSSASGAAGNSTSSSTETTSRKIATIADPARAKMEEKWVAGGGFNWIAPFNMSDWYTSSFTSSRSNYYIKLAVSTNSASSTKKANVLINEVVFAGEIYSGNTATGERVLLNATIDSASQLPTLAGEEMTDAIKRASALVDSQRIPSLAQSSYFRFGREEGAIMQNIAEMRRGGEYVERDVYYGDKTYNALGLDIAAFGTLIFGMSPFGVRFFSMLAAFGALVVGYSLVKRLTKSDRAAFFFGLLFALGSITMALAHVAMPMMVGVFALLLSFSLCHKFYAQGIRKAKPSAVMPLLLSGLAGAIAVCVHGAFLVPVLGVVALFVAGMLRQQKAKAYQLERAQAEDGDPVLQAQVLSEFRYKNVAAPVVFGVSLLLGIFLFSLLAMLPASYAYIKLFYAPTSGVSIFTLCWKAFAAGFTGGSAAAWGPFVRTFVGTGDRFAVTAAAVNPVALIAAVCGILFSVIRIVKIVLAAKQGLQKEGRAALRAAVIPLVLFLLSLVLTFFAGDSVAFVLLAYIAAFMAGAIELHALLGEGGKGSKAAIAVFITLLAVGFALLAVFTFSIPLPASFVGSFAA